MTRIRSSPGFRLRVAVGRITMGCECVLVWGQVSDLPDFERFLATDLDENGSALSCQRERRFREHFAKSPNPYSLYSLLSLHLPNSQPNLPRHRSLCGLGASPNGSRCATISANSAATAMRMQPSNRPPQARTE